MGILFTAEEKKEAYQRIISGNRAMGVYLLSHIMKGHSENVKSFRSIGRNDLADRAETAYRLVERGLIVTRSAFTEKSHILLGDR